MKDGLSNIPIKTWSFYDAPQEFKNLSENGGDEDWLSEVPPEYGNPECILWMEEGSAYGRCCVDIYDHPIKKGWKIAIGSHS